MLPILVLALRRGVMPAAIAGAAFGVIDFFFEPYAAAPIQVLLDYPVAFALLSVAGFGSRQYLALVDSGRRAAAEAVAVPWMVLGAAARFSAHFVSGIVFFGANAPAGTPVWAYSALYNLSYVLPSLVLSIVAALLVLPVLDAAVPVGPAARVRCPHESAARLCGACTGLSALASRACDRCGLRRGGRRRWLGLP